MENSFILGQVWQLQDLSLQAVSKALAAASPDQQLKALIDIVQNFPSHAKALSK